MLYSLVYSMFVNACKHIIVTLYGADMNLAVLQEFTIRIVSEVSTIHNLLDAKILHFQLSTCLLYFWYVLVTYTYVVPYIRLRLCT